MCITGITNAPIKAAVLKNEGELLQKEQSNIDYVNIVEGFLPANSQIVTSGNTKEEENILLKDLDNDGQREIITAYKSSGQPISEDEKINLLVLKKVGEKWFKALDESGQGFKLDLVLTADIDGDGREEVLLSRRIGRTAGEIFVYQWNNNVLSKVSDEGVYYSKLDIVDVPGKDIKDIAVWQHDTGDAYMIDILKWNGKIFVPEKIDCPDYFKQSVVPYYEQKVKEMPGAGFYWYYLAEAQLKSADKKGALKSAEKGLKLDTGYPPKEYFNEIKEKASK